MATVVLVGSLNPVKIEATKEAFFKYFEDVAVVGVEVSSGVSIQPIGEETFLGAENRAMALIIEDQINNLGADYYVGIEGGITKTNGRWFAFGCVCIIDNFSNKGFGTSAHFELPHGVVSRLLKREELGAVMDEIMRMENSKQKGGAISFFTKGVMNRKQLYVPGIIAALVPFNHKRQYFKN